MLITATTPLTPDATAPRPSLFASIELATRVERVETSLIHEGALAAARRAPDERVMVVPIERGLAVWAGTDSPLDKVVGVGMDGALDEADLASIERAYADRDAPVQFEVSTLAEPAIFEQLSRRGYVLAGFENVLGLELEVGRLARVADDVEVHDVDVDVDVDGASTYAEWLAVDIEATATPDAQGIAAHEDFPTEVVEHAVRDLSSASGFVASIARIDGVAAGAASLRLCDGVAQLCGAATLPEFRRRGVQSSLLSTRLAAASAAGCDLAVVTVQPGSKSQQNVQRQGFELLYARCILVRTS